MNLRNNNNDINYDNDNDNDNKRNSAFRKKYAKQTKIKHNTKIKETIEKKTCITLLKVKGKMWTMDLMKVHYTFVLHQFTYFFNM